MKHRVLMMLACLALVSITAFGGMIKRQDAIWARVTTTPITLDGKLSEAAWATAESIKVVYGQSTGLPSGGWWYQNGLLVPTDPTNATVKFLVYGDSLYVAVVCKDKSVGAVADWAHFDQLLMDLHYALPTINTQQDFEATYGYYCGSDWGDTLAGVKGGEPGFMGFAGSQNKHPRPDSLSAIWNAKTTVAGKSNDDSVVDTTWTTELVFNLDFFGYKPKQTGGDVVCWSLSIWDDDYQWPMDTLKQASTTTWIGGPWANNGAYNTFRIYTRSDVTTASGTVPAIGPDWTIPVGDHAPVIDGKLTDGIWKNAPSMSMKYGDAAIRAAYPGAMKYRSGQTQFEVNGATNPVVDASLATVKYFVYGDTLYLGFNVNDKFVQSSADANRYDGFDVIFCDRSTLDGDNILPRRDFMFRVDSAGTTRRMNDIFVGPGSWDSTGSNVRVKIALKGGTTVDTLGTSADSGYTAEMAIDLTKLGYAHGLGDGVAFFSVIFYDGDSFSGGSYGTKTWIGRPDNWHDATAWFYIDPASTITSVGKSQQVAPTEFALLGNYPNPFNPTTNIKFSLGHASEVTLEVFDVLGRQVSSQSLGVRQAGDHAVSFDASHLASGTYLYRVKMVSTGASQVGKMILLK